MFDQFAHYALGYAMARSLRGRMSPEAIVITVMDWAMWREDLQHPGKCGEGCKRDLRWWRSGAERGAG